MVADCQHLTPPNAYIWSTRPDPLPSATATRKRGEIVRISGDIARRLIEEAWREITEG
jgi:hypothetical protein